MRVTSIGFQMRVKLILIRMSARRVQFSFIVSDPRRELSSWYISGVQTSEVLGTILSFIHTQNNEDYLFSDQRKLQLHLTSLSMLGGEH
jgi:hypothetical protein